MRLLGILLGAALAVAILILVAGIPQISHGPVSEPVEVQLPLLPEPVAMVEVPPDPGIVALPSPETASPPEVPSALAPEQDTALEPQRPAPDTAAIEELRWYAFWSPFRSQIAANGFVAQLQRVTALDYRVVSIKPGVYEVAFAYTDDAEIQANLSQITAATGLQVPES